MGLALLVVVGLAGNDLSLNFMPQEPKHYCVWHKWLVLASFLFCLLCGLIYLVRQMRWASRGTADRSGTLASIGNFTAIRR